jgi:hypothetical protein
MQRTAVQRDRSGDNGTSGRTAVGRLRQYDQVSPSSEAWRSVAQHGVVDGSLSPGVKPIELELLVLRQRCTALFVLQRCGHQRSSRCSHGNYEHYGHRRRYLLARIGSERPSPSLWISWRCPSVGRVRSSVNRDQASDAKAQPRDDEPALMRRMLELARSRPRFGRPNRGALEAGRFSGQRHAVG